MAFAFWISPLCSRADLEQLFVWFGTDDRLYLTMLNHNNRSITIDERNPNRKAVLEAPMKT